MTNSITTKKERTAWIQKSIQTGEKFPISFFDSRKYIQHNLNIEDGLGPILAFMDALPRDRTQVAVRRAFEDGDYSFAHADYLLGDWGAMVGFEIHRWENGHIVEHWDNLQVAPPGKNPGSHSMTDGVVEVCDLERTYDNKYLLARFTDHALIGGEFDQWKDYFHDGELIQHSPAIADGTLAWLNALKSGAGGKGVRYARRHKVLGEGNFILVMCEGESSDGISSVPVGLYDLYRVENGRIVEHWDVTETIPPRDTWKNSNGKF